MGKRRRKNSLRRHHEKPSGQRIFSFVEDDSTGYEETWREVSERRQKGWEKGIKNEKLVFEALKRLVQRGEIISFLQADRRDSLDRRGIDFLIFPQSGEGWCIPLQVKSSLKRKREHERQTGGNAIPCIVVEDSSGEAELEQVILRALSLSTDGLADTISSLKESALLEKIASGLSSEEPEEDEP